MEVFLELLSNGYFVWCAMAVIIFGLTQILKLPIKAATKHIKNEKTRGIVNLVILIIPFGLGLLAEFLYDGLYLHNAFTGIAGLQYGSASLLVYSVFEKVMQKIGVKAQIENPYEATEEGQAIQELVEKVQEDGKIDESDLSAVEEFWEKINNKKQ